MADQTKALALRLEPGAPSEDDFQALCAALSESARGRWFLNEYARRNRAADTEMVLATLDRIEARLNGDAFALAGAPAYSAPAAPPAAIAADVPAQPAAEPLAPLMALSEVERIAAFT
jgi:hypothetical protein